MYILYRVEVKYESRVQRTIKDPKEYQISLDLSLCIIIEVPHVNKESFIKNALWDEGMTS